jgi:hypothetical protein
MKVYIITIMEKQSYGDGDFMLGVFSSKSLAEEAFTKYCIAMDSFLTDEEDVGETYADTHVSHITEELLDNMEF